MKKILLTALLLAGFTATAQVKVGSNPTTLATDAKFQVEGSTGAQTVILDNGNVGIGTATPGEKLHTLNGSVTFERNDGTAMWSNTKSANNSDANLQAVTVGDGSGIASVHLTVFGEQSWRMSNINSDNNRFSIIDNGDGSNDLNILTNGNVGIGTTTPVTALDVKGEIASISATSTKSNGFTLFDSQSFGYTGADSNPYLVNHYGLTGVAENPGSGPSTMVSGFGAVKFFTAGSQKMVVDFNGNVGIGTLLPTSKLQVVGLPVHASNAAAITAGLTVGAVYHTGDGIMRVVF